MLINLRKYSVGADLEEAGASGDDASDTAAFAALYRKTQPHEQMTFSDDPAGAALRFELLTDDPDLTLDQLRSVCSRNGAKRLGDLGCAGAICQRGERHAEREVARGRFCEVGVDLSLTRAQPKIEGNDATGYKVTLWASASYKSATYVVKEDGHYKCLPLPASLRDRPGGSGSYGRQRSRRRSRTPRLVAGRLASCGWR